MNEGKSKKTRASNRIATVNKSSHHGEQLRDVSLISRQQEQLKKTSKFNNPKKMQKDNKMENPIKLKNFRN